MQFFSHLNGLLYEWIDGMVSLEFAVSVYTVSLSVIAFLSQTPADLPLPLEQDRYISPSPPPPSFALSYGLMHLTLQGAEGRP